MMQESEVLHGSRGKPSYICPVTREKTPLGYSSLTYIKSTNTKFGPHPMPRTPQKVAGDGLLFFKQPV